MIYKHKTYPSILFDHEIDSLSKKGWNLVCMSSTKEGDQYTIVRKEVTPEENQYPKVMLVSDGNDIVKARKRVVFMEKNNTYLAWNSARTIEESEKEINVTNWKYAWGIPPVEEMTLEEVIKEFKELGREIKIIK